MPRRPAAPVQQPAVDGKAHIVEIEIGQQVAHALAVEQLRIVTLAQHLIASPGKGVALSVGME